MSDTTTVEIGGRCIGVEIEPKTGLELYFVALREPKIEDRENPTLVETQEYGEYILRNFTDLPKSVIKKLPAEEMCRLIEETVDVLVDEVPEK